MTRVQEYFTIAELAALVTARQLKGVPGTARRLRAMAEREGWDNYPKHLAKLRPSEGGRPAMEYHVGILPAAIKAAITGMARQRQLISASSQLEPKDRALVTAMEQANLPARTRQVMAARAEVLAAIEGYGISRRQSRAWAIREFLVAQKALSDRDALEAQRDQGVQLTPAQMLALAQEAILTAVEGFHIAPAVLEMAKDRRRGKPVSRSQLYEWFKARDQQGVGGLAPEPTREQAPIPEGFWEFMKFYAVGSKPDMTDAHERYLEAHAAAGHGRLPLTLAQVRYIYSNRLGAIERHVGREGILTLRSRMAYVTRTTEDMWPTTIYTADGKTFDAEIADPVTKHPIRPEITTIMDVVTRKVVGISLARSENQRSVAEALRNACLSHGIPAIFYTDRGPGYKNRTLDSETGGLMGRLGITKSHAAPYGSQAKGRIERVQATIWDRLAKRLPTYMGADQDKEAGDKVHKLTRRDLKQFGTSHLLPAWEEFVSLCEAMVAEYNARPHRSLPRFRDPETGRQRHMSPDDAWAAHVATGFEAVDVDQSEADDLFRPYEERVARRGQVQWGGNQYFDLALEPFHGERVLVGYDYHQADKVWVREKDRKTGQPGPLICVARFEGNAERYFPKSFEQAAVEKRTQAQLQRLDDKRVVVEAERDGLTMIEARQDIVADFIDLKPEPEALIERVPGGAATSKAKRWNLGSDDGLALWALTHPEELTTGQISALRKIMSSPFGMENLRTHGIDTEALRTLLRTVAA